MMKNKSIKESGIKVGQSLQTGSGTKEIGFRGSEQKISDHFSNDFPCL